jgi:hypothetical protein
MLGPERPSASWKTEPPGARADFLVQLREFEPLTSVVQALTRAKGVAAFEFAGLTGEGASAGAKP